MRATRDHVSRQDLSTALRGDASAISSAPPPAPPEPAPGPACGPSGKFQCLHAVGILERQRLRGQHGGLLAAGLVGGKQAGLHLLGERRGGGLPVPRGRLQLQHGGRGPGQPRIERQRPFGMACGPRPCRRTGGPRRTGRAGPAPRCRAIFVIASKMRFTEARSPFSWAAWAASTLTSGSSASAFPAIAACFDAAAASPAPAAMMPRDSDS